MTCDRSRPPAHRNYNLLGFPRTRASGHFVREEPTAGLRSEQEIPPMNPNPFSDTITFLVQPSLTTAIFWVLLVASAAIAVYVYRTIPGQRSVENVGDWAIRLLIGCVWWQQSLWKLPPDYTGLAYWMGQMGKHAAIPLQAYFVNQIVLPHFCLFAPVVYAAEVLTAVSLILGLFVRAWGLIGAAQILNLWLGSAPMPARRARGSVTLRSIPRALRAGMGADRRGSDPKSVARSLQC